MEPENKIRLFISRQLALWPEVRLRFDELAKVRRKTLTVNDVSVSVQFNPARTRFTSARVDMESVNRRPCFLCPANRPAEQIVQPWGNYHILINPYPVLPSHLTIANNSHLPQAIAGKIEDMLSLATFLKGFIVFYNGPQSGASAPDHFHFQAVESGHTPLEKVMDEWMTYPATDMLGATSLRKRLGFSGNQLLLSGYDKAALCAVFAEVYESPGRKQNTDGEPKMNIFCRYSGGLWQLHIIPRSKHRPACFFETGDAQMIVSPGALDMAGIIITPRKTDFERITASDIEKIYSEVAVF